MSIRLLFTGWGGGFIALILFACVQLMVAEQTQLTRDLHTLLTQQASYSRLLAPFLSQRASTQPISTPIENASLSPLSLPHFYLMPTRDTITLDGFMGDWENITRIHTPTSLHPFYPANGWAVQDKKNTYLLFTTTFITISPLSQHTSTADRLVLSYVTADFKRHDLVFNMAVNNEFILQDSQHDRLIPIQLHWQFFNQRLTIEIKIPNTLAANGLGFSYLPATTSRPIDIDGIITTPLDWLGTNPPNAQILPTLLQNSPLLDKALEAQPETIIQTFLMTPQHQILASYRANKFHRGEISYLINNTSQTFDSLFTLIKRTLIYKLRSKHIENNHLYTQIHQQNGIVDVNALSLNTSQNKDHATLLFNTDQEMWVARTFSHINTGQHTYFLIQDQFVPGIDQFTSQALQYWCYILVGYGLMGGVILLLTVYLRKQNLSILKSQLKRTSLYESSIERATSSEQIFKNLEAQVQHYSQYYLDLGRKLSHETRTPVAIIKSALEQINIQKDDIEISKRAEKACTHLVDILNAFASVQRLEQTLSQYEVEDVNITELCQQLLANYQILHPTLSFTLNQSAPKLLPLSLHCSEELIAQLLQKILDNACSYTAKGETIAVTFKHIHSDDCLISVFNPGAPIDKNLVDKIFSPFFSQRDKDEYPNTHTGFGLYIAKLITEFYQGKLSVSPITAPVAGTLFEIYIKSTQNAE